MQRERNRKTKVKNNKNNNDDNTFPSNHELVLHLQLLTSFCTALCTATSAHSAAKAIRSGGELGKCLCLQLAA